MISQASVTVRGGLSQNGTCVSLHLITREVTARKYDIAANPGEYTLTGTSAGKAVSEPLPRAILADAAGPGHEDMAGWPQDTRASGLHDLCATRKAMPQAARSENRHYLRGTMFMRQDRPTPLRGHREKPPHSAAFTSIERITGTVIRTG